MTTDALLREEVLEEMEAMVYGDSGNREEDGVTIDEAMDEVLSLRELKEAQEKELSKTKEYLEGWEKYVVYRFNKIGVRSMTSTSGKQFTVRVNSSVRIDDWEEFCDYVKKNERLDLFQQRVLKKGVVDIWEAGNSVPGLVPESKFVLSVTQR